jgi:NAD(P)-dependent dehydrogenase (short-subunit alcohol dehydrogenase family)
MITGPYAKELARDGIKVSAAIPGYVATDPNDGTRHRTPDQAAEIVATLATLAASAPTGGLLGSLARARTGSTSTTAAERTILVPDAPLRNTWRRWGVSRRNPAVRLGAAADCR